MLAPFQRGLFAPIEQRVNDWYEAESSGRAVGPLLGAFVLAWLLFQVVSYAAVDLHPDAVEVYAWSRHLEFGYFKHPPLGAWIAAAWFAVFPTTDWAFQLLSNVNAALALFFVYLIARRYLPGDKRLVVLLLLMLTPFYQFNAQRFASNQTLLSTWPLATYCFIRAFETRRIGWSIAAGLTAALAMLGKYFSIYLVLGFVVAALADHRRWSYLKSSSPWISILVGAAVLGPHIYWLVTTGFQPFQYAMEAHAGATLAQSLRAALNYAVGGAAYMALPVAVYWLATRPDEATLTDALWPKDRDRRLLVWLLWAPLVLPILTAPILRGELVPLWTMQGWYLLPILLLAPASVVLTRRAAVGIAITVLVVTLAVLLASPLLAWMKHVQGTNERRAYFRAVAVDATRLWHETIGRRLAIVDGDPNLAAATTFYSPDHPDYVPGFNLKHAPWVTEERLDREGWAAICAADDTPCVDGARAHAAARTDVRTAEIEITPRLLGMPAAPRRFLIMIVPPRDATLAGM